MDTLAHLTGLSVATLWMLVKVLIVVTVMMGLASPLTWVERRGSAMIQDRIGPNRAALFGKVRILGLVQLLADGIKFFFKEDQVPPHATARLFWLAPLLAFVPALMGFAVIPFGRSWTSGGHTYHNSLLEPGNGMGMLYPLAIGALAVYGILVAAWSSNNKWSILGGMRASAQMVSYEIGMSLAVEAQGRDGWFVWRQPLGFLVFFVCMFAETNRLPFDFAEGESEIVAGFHTEYGSMKFALLALSEYFHIITASALLTTLFLGGWQVPFMPHASALLTVASFALKVLFLCWVFIWVRWTLPRFRYDQLMFMGWKVMLPLSMANLLGYAYWMRSH
jgi:NADH-quinone oxidoreductase subunit H